MATASRRARHRLRPFSWLGGAVLLAGPPYGLARFIGWPLPRHVPTMAQLRAFLVSPLSDSEILNGLACVVWVVWAIFAFSLVVEVAAAVRGRPAPRMPVIGPVQAFAAALIGTTFLVAVPAPQAATRALPLNTALATQAVATAPLLPGQADQPPGTSLTTAISGLSAGTGSDHVAEPSHPRPRIHRVVEGDNLWDIALHSLGDGERWHEIYALNAGKPQPDGLALTDPDLIYPGWILLLPPGPAAPQASGGPAHPAATPAHHPGGPLHPSPAGSPSETPPGSQRDGHASGTVHAGQHQRRTSATVELPSGTIIGLSAALAIGLAIVIARLRRRRWRQPTRVPGTAPGEPGLSPALRQIRQAYLTASGHLPDPADSRQEDTDPVPGAGGPGTEADIPPRAADSTEVISTAIRNGQEVAADLAWTPGTGFTGLGAADAIRAIIITVLTRRSRDQGEVILCGEEACNEFAPDLTDAVPGLSAIPDAAEALGKLEAEIIHRRRLLDAAETGLAACRTANPDEHLPTILVIAQAGTPYAGRLAAILSLGRDLGITGILTGHWPPPGATWEITEDGELEVLSGPGQPDLDSARLFQVTADDADEILRTVAAAHDDGPPMEPASPPPRLLPEPPGRPGPAADGEPATQVLILGAFQLRAAGQVITKGLRRKAVELLVFLAVHRDGATSDVILDALWQDIPVERAAPILHAATTNIRRVLRDTTGATEAAFLVRGGDHLRIDPNLIGVDLWRFQEALAEAATAPDDQTRRASLDRAASQWRGDLAPDIDSLWVDEIRETLRRDAADAFTRLAELSTDDAPEQALSFLERAITVDRYQEALYQRIMRLQADLGRPDAARRTYHLLESRLVELDAEPANETVRLLQNALHEGENPVARRIRLPADLVRSVTRNNGPSQDG